MVHLIQNEQELAEIINLMPYTVRILEEEQLQYPFIAKYILTDEWNELASRSENILYIVMFSEKDLDDIVRQPAQREGIDGYKFAESKDDDEGASGDTEKPPVELS